MSNDTQVIDDIPGRRGAISYLRSGVSFSLPLNEMLIYYSFLL